MFGTPIRRTRIRLLTVPDTTFCAPGASNHPGGALIYCTKLPPRRAAKGACIMGKQERRRARVRDLVTAGALALLVAATVWTARRPEVAAAIASTRQLPVYCVERTDRKIAISFDAAWGNEDTQTLIDILNAHDVHATFFLVGGWVDKYPESVKALADAGNEVMNHSETHPHLAQLSAQQVQQEVSACAEKIEAITGVRPTLFRCPYGEYNDTVISAVRALGVEPIQWDVDSLDWKGISADEITRRVLSGVKPGSIVLFHNAAEHTPEALAGIIEALQADGYALVPISQLLLEGETVIDVNGMQKPAA